MAAKDLTAKNTVMVALCHPHGIVFTLGEGRNQKRVHIKGNAEHLRGAQKGTLPQGGFGLTEIACEDWEAIKKTYGNFMPIFKNGLIFAQERQADAKAEAKEKAGLRHGREPVIVEGTGKQAKTAPADGAE